MEAAFDTASPPLLKAERRFLFVVVIFLDEPPLLFFIVTFTFFCLSFCFWSSSSSYTLYSASMDSLLFSVDGSSFGSGAPQFLQKLPSASAPQLLQNIMFTSFQISCIIINHFYTKKKRGGFLIFTREETNRRNYISYFLGVSSVSLFISLHTGTLPNDSLLFHTLLYPESLQIHLVYVHTAGFLDRRTYILYCAVFRR